MLKAVVPPAVALATLAALAVGNAGAGATAVDFGVTLNGPANAKAKVGSETLYTIAVSNSGPDTESPKVRLTGGSGATDTGSGEPIKAISQTSTQGACKSDGFGVPCRLGDLAPGATATIEVVVEPLERDLPTLELQATVEPEKASAADGNAANDHVELDTAIPSPIKLEGVPNKCASGKVVLRVRARVGTFAKKTKLEVDGTVLGSSSKNRFKVTIKPGELDPGSHELIVVVQSAGPPLATLKDRFKTCEK
jgi:hypothetical protein